MDDVLPLSAKIGMQQVGTRVYVSFDFETEEDAVRFYETETQSFYDRGGVFEIRFVSNRRMTRDNRGLG